MASSVNSHDKPNVQLVPALEQNRLPCVKKVLLYFIRYERAAIFPARDCQLFFTRKNFPKIQFWTLHLALNIKI